MEGGIDAWNIESIVTLVREELPGEDRFQVLTQNFGVSFWVGRWSDRRHDLTLSTADISAGTAIIPNLLTCRRLRSRIA